jgi:hypothetical protein
MLVRYISNRPHKYNHVYIVGNVNTAQYSVQLVSLDNPSQRFNVPQYTTIPLWIQYGDIGYVRNTLYRVDGFSADTGALEFTLKLVRGTLGQSYFFTLDELEAEFRHE